MRSSIPGYELETPGDLGSALERLGREPGVWRAFAGGTDLMVLLEAGKLEHRKYLNVWRLAELRGIEVASDSVTLGALTTYSEIQRSEILQREFPLLCRAAALTGSVATQNRGTLGGNIANASPAADSPPALLVYEAEIELVCSGGARWIAYSKFHSAYKQMELGRHELIRRIRVPRTETGWRWYYRKVGTRRAQAISKVCMAAAAKVESGVVAEVRIALGSVAPVPLRAVATEKVMRGKRLSPELIRAAQESLAREIAPIDDVRSTARYRQRVAQNLLGEFLQQAAS